MRSCIASPISVSSAAPPGRRNWWRVRLPWGTRRWPSRTNARSPGWCEPIRKRRNSGSTCCSAPSSAFAMQTPARRSNWWCWCMTCRAGAICANSSPPRAARRSKAVTTCHGAAVISPNCSVVKSCWRRHAAYPLKPCAPIACAPEACLASGSGSHWSCCTA